jgi:hypothetical protein
MRLWIAEVTATNGEAELCEAANLEEYLQMGGAIQRNDPESGLDWLVTTILPRLRSRRHVRRHL